MNTAEILRAAAARVRRTWWDGSHRDRVAGSPCAALAIDDVCSAYHASYRLAAIALLRAIGVTENTASISIYAWNDAPGQTAENVATAMDYAALLWEQEQIQIAAEQAQVSA